MINMIKEDNFIKEIKKKNEDGLIYIIENYGWIMESIIAKHLFYLQEYREECFNDCLLAIWENIDSYNIEKSSFKNWIAGIAKYKSIDYIRKYLKNMDDINIEKLNLKIKDKSLENLLEEEMEKEINDILSCSSEEDKIIFRKFYLYGDSAKEIARDINLNEGNIYNRLSRGRKKLKAILKGGKSDEKNNI